MDPVYDALEDRRRTDFLHRLRWFWPVVESADDVQRVTLLGFWVCLWLAAVNIFTGSSSLMSAQTPTARWISVCILAGFGLFYVLAASALRRRNVAAATLLVAFEILSVVAEDKQEGHLPIDTALYSVLLVIVWRGIFLAARWESTHPRSEPLAYRAFFGNALADRWPQMFWPRFRILFWILATLAIGSESLLYYSAIHTVHAQ